MELCLLIEGSDNMIYSVYSGKDGEVPVIFNLLVKKDSINPVLNQENIYFFF